MAWRGGQVMRGLWERLGGARRGPRIFGIGLSRTGTTSLHEALQVLGYKSAHYLPDSRVAAYLEHGGALRLDEWSAYEAVSDVPVCGLFRELDQSFPHARFILTTRALGGWLASCRRHWAREGLINQLYRAPGSPWRRWQRLCRARVYGRQDFDEEAFARVFGEHERAVRDYFQNDPERLLVMDLEEGMRWGPLCSFLGKRVPAAPFPWSNRVSHSARLRREARLRHGVEAIYPGRALTQVAILGDGGAVRMESDVALALLRCDTFQAPSSSPALGELARLVDPTRTAGEALEDLRQKGWLVAEPDWARTAVPEADPRLEHAAIATSGRGLAALEVGRELVKDARLLGVEAELTIACLDDDAGASELRAGLEAEAGRGGRWRWTGLGEVRRLVDVAVREGFSRPLLEFVFFGRGSGSYRCGALRNCLLAAHAGRMMLLQDDDVRGPLKDMRFSEEARVVAGGPGSRVLRLFPAADEAEAAGLDCDRAGWERHQSMVGRLVSQLSDVDGGLVMDWGEASEEVVRAVRRPGARVRLSFLGFRGDAGTMDGSMRWRQPLELVRRWVEDGEHYAASHCSRQMVYGAGLRRIDRRGFHFTSVGIDAREMMPPFFPVGRGSDMVLSRMLAQAEPTAVYAHLPWSLLHRPVKARPDFLPCGHPEAVFPYFEQHMLIQDVVQEAGEGVMGGLVGQARAFRKIAGLDDVGLRDWMTEHLRARAGEWIERLEEVAGKAKPCAAAAADLEMLQRQAEDSFVRAPILWPVELNGVADPVGCWRRLMADWAGVLEIWPEWWKAMRERSEWREVLAPRLRKTGRSDG